MAKTRPSVSITLRFKQAWEAFAHVVLPIVNNYSVSGLKESLKLALYYMG